MLSPRSARPTGAAIAPSANTHWPARSPKPNDCSPAPSTTPANRDTAGPKAANCSTSHQPPQQTDTGKIHDQLDEDHLHNAADSAHALVPMSGLCGSMFVVRRTLSIPESDD